MHEASLHRKDKINGVISFHRHKFHDITLLRIENTESQVQVLSDSSTGGAAAGDLTRNCVFFVLRKWDHHLRKMALNGILIESVAKNESGLPRERVIIWYQYWYVEEST